MIRPAPVLGAFFALAFALSLVSAGRVAVAQPYCMIDDDGQRSCGIPTLQECEDTVRGVGGSCVVDESAQLPAPVEGPLQRMFDRDRANPNLPYTDDVPPPPGN